METLLYFVILPLLGVVGYMGIFAYIKMFKDEFGDL
jgi:hypothetical protein